MHSSWFEEVRFPLQSIETLEKAIVSQMLAMKDNPKQRSFAEHRINNFAEMIQERSKDILVFLKEESAMKKQQFAIIEGQKGLKATDKKKTSDVIWQNFYDRSRQIKDYYKKNDPQIPDIIENSVQYFRRIVFNPPFKEPEFSLQENKGKFVDMHSLYVQYLNIYKVMEDKDNLKLHDYLWFLQNMDKFDDFPLHKKMKNQKKYQAYLKSLIKYLESFCKRSKPLFEIDELFQDIKEKFEVKYLQGKIPGWQEIGAQNQEDWQYCSYCDKLFIKQRSYIEHLSGKNHNKFLKLKEGKQQENAVLEQKQQKAREEYRTTHSERKKEIAYDEYMVRRLREQLASIIYDTMNLVRKKQTRGYEDVDQFIEEESESEDADAPIYNPKNLPLGWDGKPIPYWLYKLHGLGIEYKCQICGNFSYWGRRAFETHFQEWRHTYGMKCLKIPNTIHFKDVTSINDALALHEKLNRESRQSQFRPEMEEEFQDNEGNILNKKTYFDMKKQGLID